MEWAHEILPYSSGDDSLSTTAIRYDHYSGNPYLASNPYYSVNDYMAPPNDQLPAYVAGDYHPHSDMAHFRYKMGYPAMGSSAPWASGFTGHNRTSYSSNTSTISTRDSMSPGLPEEAAISTFHSPGAVFGSPTISQASIPNCRGVALRDVQGISDTIAEERINVAGTQDLSTEFVDTGLPTPASETGVSSVDTARAMTFDYGAGYREEDSREHLPSPRKSGRTKSKAAPSKAVHSHNRQLSNGKIHKKGPSRSSTSGRKSVSANSCPECRMDCKNEAGLERHLQKAHVRPFSCIFDRYGCKATFGAKNEWKRHCSTQHLRLSFYRCDVGACSTQSQQEHRQLPDWDLPIAAAESCNDFNRKDLFVQHHRRMHAPDGYKESTQDEKDRFKAQCERVAQRCRVSARAPPPRTICGLCEAKGCPVVFEGVRAWETRMEHVGRHLENEKGDKTQWVEDENLKQWLIQEGLIQRDTRGEWKLTDHMVPEEGRGSRRSSHK